MKTKKNLINKSLNLFCSFLIALAPAMIETTVCFLLWGEVECPDELKELYSK